MPAVGPDGKNVMKLIPVKKVNGHFFHTQVLPSRNVCVPAHTSPVPSPQNRIPTLQPTADGRFILKTPLEVNTVFNSVKSQHRGSNALFQSSANQMHVPKITQNMAQNTLQSPVQPSNKAVIVSNSTQLSNTVKPPALASGHYLQIPANATVRTLPASALPSSIQNRICHSTNDSSPLKGLPMVLYVSPVSSLKLDQQTACVKKPSALPQTLSHTSTVSVVKSLEESPRNSQGSTTPMKWVVEEREGSSAPYLIPVTSPNMSSDILKAVKHMESSRLPDQVAKEPVSTDTSKETVTPGKDNALVMCNGKVYFVAKRNSEVTKDMITNAESKLHPRNPAQSPTAALGTVTPNVSQKQDPKSPGDHKKPSDIIDLCDDDDESSTGTSSGRIIIPSDTVSEHDEDSNVIFVSYIPPKSSETESSKDVTETTSTNCVNDADDTKLDTESMETGGELLNSTCSAELDASKCDAVHVNEPALEGNEASSETLEVVCDQQTDVTEKSFEEMVPDQKDQPKSDSEFRRTFGITSDLSVSLQKIDVPNEAQEGHPQNEKRLINKRTLDGIRKLIRDSKIETKIKQLIQTQVPEKTGKRKRLERNGDKTSSDTFSFTDEHSSPPSNTLVECDHETQSVSAEQSTDRQVVQTCQGAEEETPSTSGACDVSDTTINHLYLSSSLEPVQAHTAKCQSDSPACCSGLRKTPPRSSKGCGRVCTACPCGTKVGGVAGNSASKPGEKPTPCSSITSSKSVLPESNRDAITVDRLADSVSRSTNSNSASGKSGDETTRGSQLHVSTDVKSTLLTATFSTSQPEATPAMTGTCSSSSRCTQDTTRDKPTSSQLETGAPKPSKPNEMKTSSSSDRQLYYTSYKIPSELYSSVVLDPEEIKRQERIKRLKDLLQEKEAALEKLRKSM